MLLDLRLKIYQFFKRHKNKIVIFLIIIGIIYLINQYLKHHDFQAIPSTTYNPDTPIMVTEGEEVPSNLKEPIYALIEEYFDACNEKDYEKATFEILSSRNLLKKLIYYLNNELKLKYVEIRDFLEIPRGVMDDLKQNNKTLF